MSPLAARDIIDKGSGTDFDPEVVNTFLKAFRCGEMDIGLTALEILQSTSA